LDRPIRRAPCRRPGCALQASHLRSCPVRPIPLLAAPGLEPAGGLPPRRLALFTGLLEGGLRRAWRCRSFISDSVRRRPQPFLQGGLGPTQGRSRRWDGTDRRGKSRCEPSLRPRDTRPRRYRGKFRHSRAPRRAVKTPTPANHLGWGPTQRSVPDWGSEADSRGSFTCAPSLRPAPEAHSAKALSAAAWTSATVTAPARRRCSKP
jgi:hypothetical protein